MGGNTKLFKLSYIELWAHLQLFKQGYKVQEKVIKEEAQKEKDKKALFNDQTY